MKNNHLSKCFFLNADKIDFLLKKMRHLVEQNKYRLHSNSHASQSFVYRNYTALYMRFVHPLAMLLTQRKNDQACSHSRMIDEASRRYKSVIWRYAVLERWTSPICMHRINQKSLHVEKAYREKFILIRRSSQQLPEHVAFAIERNHYI